MNILVEQIDQINQNQQRQRKQRKAKGRKSIARLSANHALRTAGSRAIGDQFGNGLLGNIMKVFFRDFVNKQLKD